MQYHRNNKLDLIVYRLSSHIPAVAEYTRLTESQDFSYLVIFCRPLNLLSCHKLTPGTNRQFCLQLFDRLRFQQPRFDRKIIPVTGDIELPGLGISDADHSCITSNVSLFLHVAASIHFTDTIRYHDISKPHQYSRHA